VAEAALVLLPQPLAKTSVMNATSASDRTWNRLM
jgi:hypothetical protein